jgi:hypothetical protein
VHVDIKKLGRFASAGKRVVGDRHPSRGYGWECVHVMVDDLQPSRLCRAPHRRACPERRRLSAARARVVRTTRSQVERVMPDNDSAHVSQTTPRPATNWAFATRAHGPTGHKPTARIERFIQTLQNECAYGRV